MAVTETTNSSVSRGSFLFNPSSTAHVVTGSMKNLPMEQDKLIKKREQLFAECWEIVKKEIDDIISSQHDKVFDDLVNFIASSQKKLQGLHSTVTLSERKLLPPRLEVSSAVLIAGVNMPDHAVLYQHLEEKIREETSPFVVLLRAKNCNSGMKATMKRILLQLEDANMDQMTSDGEEEDHKPLPNKTKLTKSCCSMRVLCNWYRDAVAKLACANKPDPVEGSRPLVVIIIEDFEAFLPQILKDLILSLSPHQSEFPAVLVLVVATSVDVVHQVLPHAATSLLSIEQFHTQHSALTLAQIIKRVLLSHHLPFKLGPKTFNFLLHQFFYCNFSLADFARGLKFAMMDHFYWQPLSVLCSVSVPEAKQWSGMSRGLLEAIRATPSTQRFIETLGPSQRLDLLEQDSKLKNKVKELLYDLKNYHQTFYPLLSCLHHLTHDLPDAPLGRKLHEVYLLCLEQNIAEQSKLKTAWTLLNLLSKESLCGKVSCCIQELEQAIKLCSGSALVVFENALSSLQLFRQEATITASSAASQSIPQETTGERKMKFQERLRQIGSRTGYTAFELARKKLTDSLLPIFTKHLHTPRQYPLHEAFYFDQVSSLQLDLVPAPRSAIQTALSNPAHYLSLAQGSAGASEQDAISSNIPDICILYQLHLECGQLINLYDLLQSFISVVVPDAEVEQEEGGKKKDVDPVLHARFIKAVSELQLLGFIKPTQRKTDHVQRLTWGSL